MKKALKGLGYFVLMAIVLTSALAIYIAITGIPRYARNCVGLAVRDRTTIAPKHVMPAPTTLYRHLIHRRRTNPPTLRAWQTIAES